MYHDDIQAIRRILIQTAWWTRQRQREHVRECKDALKVGDETRLRIETNQLYWQIGYQVARLQAARLIRKEKRKVTNG